MGPTATKEGKYLVKIVQLPTAFPLTASDYVKEGNLSDPEVSTHIEALHLITKFWVKVIRQTRMVHSEIYHHNFTAKCIPDTTLGFPARMSPDIPLQLFRQGALRERGWHLQGTR